MDLPFIFDSDVHSDTFHLGGFLDEKLLCVGTFIKSSLNGLEGEQYQLRGMATSPDARNKGLGKQLLEHAVNDLQEKEVNYLWCNAREIAVPFYEKCGFYIIGNSFEVPQIGTHYKMVKKIQKNEEF
ncbi:GNAT family N-acetyltransferase [Tenacibaculum sp. IB213877]|uniref:GNAT family N-acetyltransferase n=1 Tax=Tenacibaculum sp. IB213877 TaxID=3097351 RepID=UPI002A59F645|nr:GNAT family N-acetyltransferase [Tenacibaculum sp. IB213877]MDY0781488.1 GNAT family N-acetyltransferase [Tenacibaculum sp. IB213877]